MGGPADPCGADSRKYEGRHERAGRSGDEEQVPQLSSDQETDRDQRRGFPADPYGMKIISLTELSAKLRLDLIQFPALPTVLS